MTIRPAHLLPSTGLALVLALTGCGGGGKPAADGAACAPAPAQVAGTGAVRADVADAEVDRPVSKHDPRELDRMAPDQAAIVALLRAVEQGQAPAAPAAEPHAAEPAEPAEPCPPAPPAEPAGGGH